MMEQAAAMVLLVAGLGGEEKAAVEWEEVGMVAA